MSDDLTNGGPASRVHSVLHGLGVSFEVMDCDPDLADTAVFCQRYGVSLDDSANTILVKAKTGAERYVACVLLADSRLDVNHTVRKKIASRRVSFASAQETKALTGMEIGGVTPFSLPPDMALWVDSRVMSRPTIILGGGNRSTKLKLNPRVFERTAMTEVVDGLATPIPPVD